MLVRLIIVILINGFISLSVSYSQEQTKPLSPSFQYLTLNPASGTPTLNWTPPSFNPLHPNPTGYIIYIPNQGGGWLEIDTVSANTFTYTDLTGLNQSGLNQSIRYNIASLGPTEPSPLVAPHASIFLTIAYDSCSNKLDLKWNHYVGWGNRIEKYNIYAGNNTNWADFTMVGSVSGVQNIFYYTVEPNKQLYFYIEAIKRDSNPIQVSRSNLAFINTRIAVAPQFMYIDSLIAKDTYSELHFVIDNTTEYKKFRLVRWEQTDSIASIFTAKNLFEFTDPNTIFFSDNTDSWTARSKPFYYKINAFDGCNKVKKVSNLSNTITIRAFVRGLKATISWDRFYTAKSNPVTYKLYRISFGQNANPPVLIYEAENPSELKFIDDFSQFEGLGYQPNFCYFVEAYETLDTPNKQRLSRSRTTCVDVIPDVVMPNAIDPNSNIVYMGRPRNLFGPTVSFESTFKLIIYNRWGGTIYQGNSPWDGRMPNGQLAQEGAYVYRVEVYTESGKMITKTGTVTVIYNLKK
jgi:hypothetical protein